MHSPVFSSTHNKSALPMRSVVLASLASGLEYYDFLIYAYMLPFFSLIIFPPGQFAWRQGWLWFAIGCLFRPLGALLWGSVADRYGRKGAMLAIMSTLSLSILAMSILPGYALLGLLAPILFMLLRLLQSASFGADLPCGVVFLIEHAPKSKRGFYAGIMIANVGLGSCLAALVCVVLNNVFSTAQMSWAWRLAFVFGGLLAFLAIFLRKRLLETPVFLQNKQSNLDGYNVKPIKKTFFYGCGLLLLPATMVMLNTSFPTLLHYQYNYPVALIYRTMMWGSLLAALLIPLTSLLGDAIGRERLFFGGSILVALLALPMFLLLLPQHTVFALLVFQFIYNFCLAVLAGAFFVHLAELFPVMVRARAYAGCYNLVYAVLGILPYALSYVQHVSYVLACALPLLAVIAMLL